MIFLIAVLLIAIPTLTYYVSRTLFYRTANNLASGRQPPTIPYLLPGVFHTFNLAYDGPQKFFATLLEHYGKHAPFVVRVGLRSFVVLRDPAHVKKVATASKLRTSQESHINEVIFGPSKTGPSRANAKNANNELDEHARTALAQKYLTGPSLTTMVDHYVSILSRNLNDKMFQRGSWTQIEDFWSFFEQVLTRCSIETHFGSAIFKQYPGLIKDFWKFEDAIDSFIPGMPQLLVLTAHTEPRNRLLQGIGKWLKANHSGSEFAKITAEDPDWDEYKGSKFVQERDDVLAKTSLDVEARAAEMLSVMHSANVNIVPSAIWTMIETLRKLQLHEDVTTEVARHISTNSATYKVDRVANTPIFQSVHQEIRRLRMAQCTTYTNENDIALDDRWTLPQGHTAISFSRDIALNDDAWATARPRTVERPLGEFWAQRFLIPDKQASKVRSRHQSKESKESGSFNIEGLEPLVTNFGHEQQLALGSDYAKAMQAATLCVLLSEFELQLCDDSQEMDAVTTPVRKEAFGAVRPLDRIAVRIRKR